VGVRRRKCESRGGATDVRAPAPACGPSKAREARRSKKRRATREKIREEPQLGSGLWFVKGITGTRSIAGTYSINRLTGIQGLGALSKQAGCARAGGGFSAWMQHLAL
jgi:hypothetical protein